MRRDLKSLQVFRTGDLSLVLGVAHKTVANWFDSGLLKGYRIPSARDGGPRGRRVTRETVIAFCRKYDMQHGLIALGEPVEKSEH